jgi:hypothetical protein
MADRRVGLWIGGVIVVAGVLTMIFAVLGIGLVVTIIGLVALGISAILPPGDAPPSA